MKKNNRKGFTIVELVIVIAVIAILATVLVPTFGNMIQSAKNTALIEEIKNEHTNYTIKYAKEEGYTDDLYILIEGKYYQYEDGALVLDNDGKPVAVDSISEGAAYYDAETDTLETAEAASGSTDNTNTEGTTNT